MSSALLPSGFDDSESMSYAIRMVIPMKREFGRTLDVPHFLHDFAYAREVVDQAKSSHDSRLRECAAYLESKMLGPRNSMRAPAGSKNPAPEMTTLSPAPDKETMGQSELDMRAEMMKKYRSGLR
ncbi:MAG: hypothetical protein V4772_24550 [Pseudomonadota bacterium]